VLLSTILELLRTRLLAAKVIAVTAPVAPQPYQDRIKMILACPRSSSQNRTQSPLRQAMRQFGASALGFA
jgi:hypothetical protein